MGRPEPSVLFAQSFVHSQLDEYVDEVLFAEPIVISACEFLEQNASPSTSTVSLIGATSPPSFALEVFVHCEGESRFRRLCQPFLYSHSSSNVLEVEAVVTNHLVVRGSYRCLTLVVYGNTAEDLGQFNIEVDLDSSLANLVCSPSEGKLEDLPSALRSIRFPVEESISSLKSISLPVTEFDLSAELKEFLLLTLKIYQISDHEDVEYKILTSLVSALSSYVASDHCGLSVTWDQNTQNLPKSKGSQHFILALAEARNVLLEYVKFQKLALGNEPSELLEEEILFEPNVELATSELLVYMFNQCFPLMGKTPVFDKLLLSQNKSMALRLGLVLLLCSARESCFRFVNVGGMEQITRILSHDVQKPTSIILVVLTIVEHATRHAFGCEGFLGWWPREDETLEIGNSDGYCHILRLLLQKQRHDVASLATYVLHRLRFYEVISRYKSAVLSALGDLSDDCRVTTDRLKSLVIANSQLKKVLKLLNMGGPIEDPSRMNFTRASLLGQVEGLLSYRATNKFIVSSTYGIATEDIDIHLLSLLKERGFLPLSAALLSSPILRSANNYNSTMDILVEIAASIELILLSLLCCCSGLTFLLLQPEATATLVLSLQGVEDMDEAECLTRRHASVLVSKGFFCRPQDVGMITELHLRVGIAIDRLLTAAPHSEEQLWLLWELCAISRSDCGRQALLAVGQFPKSVSVLMEALHSYKDLEPISIDSGTSPLSLAIFHSAAEIFEVIVTDSTASSLASWIGHAVELHKALHSSSPGSNRKDAPTRLLEWIDAGVVYHKNGAIGLLRYAAVLASGGDAHLTSTSILVSDSMDVENVVGDSGSGSDSQVVDNLLGKLVSDKYFDGVTLRSTSIVQLTATFRILAFISENSVVAASLYEEGVVTLLYVILVNCKFMLERSSNTYDHLVDEGAECNSTSDLLMERSHEQSLVDLLIPSLVLLINILHSLHEAKEHYRNTKLLNAVLQLHREISPKLVGFATEISSPYPISALGLGAVCHLLTSALACWPVFGWTPGLFHRILESVQATSSLALGPKDACSLLCLLGDLFPDEGIWLWKNGMPSLSAIRTLSVGTLLGPQGERHVDWYLQARHQKVLLGRLMPQLSKIAQIVMHFACTALLVVQDMVRVFIIRIACQRTEFAVILLQPIISWMGDYINDASLSETNVFKVYRLLDFIASLLEHPCAKTLLLKEGIIRRLDEVLDRCHDASNSDGKLVFENRVQEKNTIDILSWSIPTFKALALIFDPQTSTQSSGLLNKYSVENLSSSDTSSIGRHLLKLCQVLPVGRELLACLVAFKELASCSEGRNALASILLQIPSSSLDALEDGSGDEDKFPSEDDWRSSPFLNCWKKLLRSLHANAGASFFSIETAHALSLGALGLCMEGKNLEGVAILKALFGLHYDPDGSVVFEEKLMDVHAFIILLDQMINENEYSAPSNKFTMCQVKESVKSMLLLLQKAVGSLPKVDGVVSSEGFSPSENVLASLENTVPQMPMASLSMNGLYDEGFSSFSHVWKSNTNTEKSGYNSFEGLADKFLWECPDSPDRLTTPSLPVKRKLPSSEGSIRRARDNNGSEIMVSSVFSRGLGTPGTSSVPTRRDTFRQRKPNTSRPPSMHVDDYVARERNIDGVSSGSNVVISSQRGSSSGRPPSIHVDEFMARQRERQNPIAMAVGNAAQIRDTPLKNEDSPVKSDRSRQLKADLDDDLQEIDIVFDEESESDDRLPFPQPDDNLNLQPAPLIIGESSPGSVVEETEGDPRENTTEDGNSHSEYPLKSVSRPETSIYQDSNASSEKGHPWANAGRSFYNEKSDESKYATPIRGSKGVDIPPSTNHAVFPSHFYNASSTASPVQSGDSWLPRATFYPRDSPQRAANVSLPSGSQKFYDQKFPVNQPPLPPLPPPSVSSLPSQIGEPAQSHSSPYVLSASDVQPPISSGYTQQAYDVHLHSEGQSPAGNSSLASSIIGQPILDFKYSWATASPGSRSSVETSSISIRPLPPLPLMPPPFSASPMAQSSATSLNTQSSSYNQNFQLPVSSIPLKDSRYGLFPGSGNGLTSYSMPPFTPSMVFSSPVSGPGTLYSSPTQQQVQNLPSLSQPNTGQSSIQSVQPRPPPPPPPPQTPRPQPPQHPRPPVQLSQPMSEQVVPLQQNPMQTQLQPLQVPQKLHIPQLHLYYQTQQQEQLPQPPQNLLERAQSLNMHVQTDNVTQQQQDSGMTLQQYFTSPEAIQSLLSDRDKLCQLLEQHPKLMQMLQERLGQL